MGILLWKCGMCSEPAGMATDIYTRCRTPAALAASTAARPSWVSLRLSGVIKKTLSTPSKAIDREPGFSRSPTQGSTPAGRDLSLLAKRLMQRNLTPRSRRLFMTSPPTAPVPPITNTFITTSTITQRSHRANRGSKKLTCLHRSAGANQARTLAFITKQNQAQNITITTHIRHAVAHAGTVAVKESLPTWCTPFARLWIGAPAVTATPGRSWWMSREQQDKKGGSFGDRICLERQNKSPWGSDASHGDHCFF